MNNHGVQFVRNPASSLKPRKKVCCPVTPRARPYRSVLLARHRTPFPHYWCILLYLASSALSILLIHFLSPFALGLQHLTVSYCLPYPFPSHSSYRSPCYHSLSILPSFLRTLSVPCCVGLVASLFPYLTLLSPLEPDIGPRVGDRAHSYHGQCLLVCKPPTALPSLHLSLRTF